MIQFRPGIRAFLVALLATATMVALRRLVFVEFLGIDVPLLPFLFSVLAAAWASGIASGLLATAFGAAAGIYVSHKWDNFPFLTSHFQVRLLIFTVLGGLVSWLTASGQTARRRAESRHRQLEQEIVERKAVEAVEGKQRARLAAEIQRREEMELALREREERIRMAVESANIGTWDFNPLTGERKWSDRTKIMFGLPPDADVSNVLFLDRLHPEDRERAKQAVQKALDPGGDGTYEIECRVIWPDGTTHWFISKGQALFDGEKPGRKATRFLGTLLEITERKQTEIALRQAEEKFRAVATHAPVGIFQTDAEGCCLFVNETWCGIVGASMSEGLGDGWQRFVHPEDRLRVIAEWHDATRHRRNHATDFRFLNPQKGVRWVVGSAVVTSDSAGAISAYVGTIVDVTERKMALDALEVEQELLRRTIEIQDRERQLISYEIHDGLVQYVTGALMQLEAARGNLESTTAIQQVENVLGVLRKTVAEGRRLINGIRTPVLDGLGVVAAVEQLIDEEDRAHVQLEFVKDENLGRMSPQIEEALYRITQEAMTNIRKHSRSKRTRVELARRGDRVHLEVRDWGVGFTPSTRSKNIHGLKGMVERARLVGGQCKVESTPGEGTQIIVDVPYLGRI